MNDLQEKYNSPDAEAYKEEILSVSTWSENDFKVIEEMTAFIQINIEQW